MRGCSVCVSVEGLSAIALRAKAGEQSETRKCSINKCLALVALNVRSACQNIAFRFASSSAETLEESCVISCSCAAKTPIAGTL